MGHGILMTRTSEVRFTPMNGYRRFEPSGPKSAINCPAAIKGLFDHLIGMARNSVSRKIAEGDIRQVDRVRR
jgi:hypothetical protein